MTLLVSADGHSPQFSYVLRTGSNNQEMFVRLVADMIVNGALRPGDTLVLDNARIHTGRTWHPTLNRMLQANNIGLAFLPTYSPELNPCELVFARLKQFMQSEAGAPFFDPIVGQWVSPFRSFEALLDASLNTITLDQIRRMYLHCLHPQHF